MSSAVSDAKTMLFQDSLADVVKQMRNSRKDEASTIAEAIADIKAELKSPAQHVKVIAVVKMTYFAMLGHSGEYGAFNIIEVMADNHFQNKRAGYIAAAVILNEDSPVLPLCTATIKRDLASPNHYEVGLALYALSSICTPDLARDLVSDVVNLLDSPRAVVRKKATLCLYKIFLQFPDALRPTYPKLKEKLEDGSERTDSDPAVRGAVVNVLCELARRNPGNFLNLVPPFYALLSSIHNNWTLIKVVKVFGYFAPLEPRLGKKLVDPITNIITTTHAKSVQYECILAVANGMSKVASLTKLAVERMKGFVEDRDANLKYLGLDAMSRILKDAPKQLSDQRETVLACLDDRDPSVRVKAMAILRGMVTKKNLVPTINAMFDHITLSPPDEEWSNRVIEAIIATVRDDDYALVNDFEWYLAVLVDLAQVELQAFDHGALIEQEFVSIITRVNGVRQVGVESLCSLLDNPSLLSGNIEKSTNWKILRAAAFVCGEYPHWLPNKARTVKHLLAPSMRTMPASLQATAVSAVGKILAFAIQPSARHIERRDGEEELEDPDDSSTVADIVNMILSNTSDVKDLSLAPVEKPIAVPVAPLSRMAMPGSATTLSLSGPIAALCTSADPVVQERALFVRFLATNLPTPAEGDAEGEDDNAGKKVAKYHGLLFGTEVEPVAEGAQEAVEAPEGLDFDTPFCDTLPQLIADSDNDDDLDSDDSDADSDDSSAPRKKVSVEAAIRAERDRQARRRTEVSAFYLKGEDEEAGSPGSGDLPDTETLDMRSMPSRFRSNSKKQHTISKTLSKPSNYVSPTAKRPSADGQPVDEVAAKLRHISVDRPIGRDEALPTAQPYKREEAKGAAAAETATAASNDVFEELDAKRLNAGRTFNPVTVVDSTKVLVAFQPVECKAKKDGTFILQLNVSTSNVSEGHALYDAKLTIATPPESLIQLHSDSVALETVELASGKVKPGNSTSIEIGIAFPGLPDTTAEPLPFTVTFTEKKKEVSVQGTFALETKYFLAPAAPIDVDTFNGTVLPKLASAGCVAASVPVAPKADLAVIVAQLKSALRLSTVEVFKDCVSLVGTVAQRKKAEPHYVAVLVKEDFGPVEEGGEDTRMITFYVKSTAEALLNNAIADATVLAGGSVE